MIYGCVSTDGQSVDAQVKRLRAASAAKVYRETASRAKTERAQLRRVVAQLDAGDVLVVTAAHRSSRLTSGAKRSSAATPAKPRARSHVSHSTILRLVP
jgi:hypothetical protein